MIDRIEELLSEMAEEEEEEQEDVPARKRGKAAGEGAWTAAGAGGGAGGPGGRPGAEGKPQSGLTALRRDNGASTPRAADRQNMTAGETDAQSAPANRELWKDGPVWTVRGGPPVAQRAAAVGRTARAEEALQPVRGEDLAWDGLKRAVRGGTAGTALDSVGRFGTAQAAPEQAGLKGLYRQTVQGLRPAAPALPPEQAGRTARAQEPGSAASLAVDELDRAVRRDSRRYDGGMSIY